MPPPPAVTTNTDLVRFRTRQSVRDSVGLQGDNNRVIDTGNIIAEDVQSVNGELLWYLGPLWVQSEACLAHVDNAVFPASSSATHRGDLNYYGTYVEVGYFLTGDNRGYDVPRELRHGVPQVLLLRRELVANHRETFAHRRARR